MEGLRRSKQRMSSSTLSSSSGSTVLSRTIVKDAVFTRRRRLLQGYAELQRSSAVDYVRSVSLQQMKHFLELEAPLIANKVELIEPLACGATSIVVKGKIQDEFVAVKIVSLTCDSLRKQCEKEAKIHQKINGHKNIVNMKDFIIGDKFAIFVHEYVQSNLLDLVLNDFETIDETTKRVIVKQLVEAVEHLHSQNIIHLDIKLDNVLITKDYEVKLCDFGSAKYVSVFDANSQLEIAKKTKNMLKRNSSSSPALSLLGLGKEIKPQFLGTPLYCSPESLVGGARSLTCKSDMWSVGVLSYILLSGYVPFEGLRPVADELATQIMANRFTFHARHWRNLSLASRDFVSQLMTLDITKRLSCSDALQHTWLVDVAVPVAAPKAKESTALVVLSEKKIVPKKLVDDKLEILKAKWLLWFSLDQQKLALSAFYLLVMYIHGLMFIMDFVYLMCACQAQTDLVSMRDDAESVDEYAVGFDMDISTTEQVETKERQLTVGSLRSRAASDSVAKLGSWIDDSEACFCRGCDVEFTLFNRRHHCRKCGQIMCSDCAQVRGGSHSHRVCTLCIGK